MTRPGTGAGSGTRELFQLGVEGGEFVRHLGVAHGFDPLLGKPDASIAPFEACIFLGRQHHEFIAAVQGGDVGGGDRHRLAAGAGSAKARKPCCSSASVMRTISMQTP